MRNLLQYPITAAEILEVLEGSIRAHDGEIGGLNQCVLYSIQQHLIDHPDVLQDIVELLRV